MEIRTADLFTREPPSLRPFGSWSSSSRTSMRIPVDRFVQCEWLRKLRGLLPSPAPQALPLESTPRNVHWDLDAVKVGPRLIEASSHPLRSFDVGLPAQQVAYLPWSRFEIVQFVCVREPAAMPSI